MSAIPALDFELYGDAAIEDPLPYYKAVRDAGPVVWLSQSGLHAMGRYRDVRNALRNTEVFSSARGVAANDETNHLMQGIILASDPPAHAEMRAVLGAPLLPGALKQHQERIEAAAEGLIDRLTKLDRFDGMADLARFLPLTIVSRLVGLPEEGRQNMLRWASAAFDSLGPDNERTACAQPHAQELREYVAKYAVPELLPPEGWIARLYKIADSGAAKRSTCMAMLRDYIAPSLDTTISATGELIYQLALNPDVWEQIRQDPSLVPGAVDEAVRLGSPVFSFTRYVTRDHEVDGTRLAAGSRVAVLFASANRDERHWDNPDAFDPRRNKGEHVGFGHGIHMCAGMHLARLEMQSLLKAMIPRVARIEIGKPTRVRNNIIRAFEQLPTRFIAVARGKVLPRKEVPKGVWRTDTEGWLGARIVTRQSEADDIVSLELEPIDGAFPNFTAGSHVDVQVKPGLVRQYSLSGDPAFPHRYRLGVLRDAKSRGGSIHVHEAFEVGREIRIGLPRNHFELSEEAPNAILMAGGIGITPLLSMMYRLREIGMDYRLHYAARSASRVAFRKELGDVFADRVHFHTDDGSLGGKFDARAVLAEPSASTHLYVCGPPGFIDHVTSVARDTGWLDANVHVERFGAEIDLEGEPFTVVARRSGLEVEVPPGTSIATQLIKAGVEVPMSCQSGVCGTCLTRVVSGSPDHRDGVQTDIEKASNERIAVCCSRSHSRILVLDI